MPTHFERIAVGRYRGLTIFHSHDPTLRDSNRMTSMIFSSQRVAVDQHGATHISRNIILVLNLHLNHDPTPANLVIRFWRYRYTFVTNGIEPGSRLNPHHQWKVGYLTNPPLRGIRYYCFHNKTKSCKKKRTNFFEMILTTQHFVYGISS